MIARPRRPAPVPTAKMVHLPAPVGGLNSVAAASMMPVTDAPVIYNMLCSEGGLVVRPGRGWNYDTGGDPVRSIFPFNGSLTSGANDKVFTGGPSGIYEGGVRVQSYGTTTGDSGYGCCTAFNTSADRYLIVTDEVNGYWLRAESTGAWTQVTMGGGATQVSGGDPTKFVNVTAFKNRLWFTEKNSTRGWYLGTNAVFGAATSFDFGARFKAGGDLRGLYNWSYDGGNGIDTLLCGISGGGDVVIYQGTDPSTAASFSLKGTWSVTGVPPGRRIATDHGGDLLILSTTGVIPLSRLVVGGSDLDRTQYSTYKITNAFARAMATYGTSKGWAIMINPSDASLLINVPCGGTTLAYQFVMSLATKAWSQYGHHTSTTCIGYPITSGSGVLNNVMYFGDSAGNIYNANPIATTSHVDQNSNPAAYVSIEYQVITSFQDFGAPRMKVVQQVRPRFLTYMNQTTSGFAGMFGAAARYNYDTTELTANTSSALPTTTSALGTSPAGAYQPIFGASGMGSAVAIGVRGRSTCTTTLIGMDVLYTEGGFL